MMSLMRPFANWRSEKAFPLNRAAVKLLKKGAGLMDGKEGGSKVGSSLDWFIGSMSREEADELEAVIEEEFEKIDESMWR